MARANSDTTKASGLVLAVVLLLLLPLLKNAGIPLPVWDKQHRGRIRPN
jgi:hypothetical protein